MNDENIQYQRTRSRGKKANETPFMTKFLTAQLITGAIIILILFAVSKTGGTAYNNISEFYGEIKKTDMAVSEVLSTFKNAAKETFRPIDGIQNTEENETGEGETSSPDIFYVL